ncbi:NADPH-dependent F420 reductase [Pantoea sp. B65]|uniref:NADPH-dependent F420 reductase n=1 Tax=Pantoea sp. B65 TaxID=2813359 RepID=UPI0039B44949
MKIAVIGTGNMGAGLAALFAAKGYPVVIGHREPAKAAALAEKLGAGIQGGGIAAAFGLADVVFLALPYTAAAEVFALAGDISSKVVVDISNPISADFSELVIGHTTSAAEEIQALVPQARVVKAFNTIFAQLLPEEARHNGQLQVLIAADDNAAKQQVSALARAVNFDVLDAGPLKNSRYLEPVGEMNIQLGYFLGQGPVVAPAWIKA